MDYTFLIAIFIMIVLLGVVLLLWPSMLRSIAKGFYKQSYQAIPLNKQDIQPFPPTHHLEDVPWIISSLPLSQSICLQMIASQHGLDYPRPYYDFLMAYTYGTSIMPGVGFMPLGTDPEMGLLTASPLLGLKRCYYTTSDEKLFLTALRSFISRGYAVRVALDEGSMYKNKDFTFYSVVVIGYDAKGFNYYEPVNLQSPDLEPGQRAPGESGLFVADQALLQAVRRVSQELNYPWRYAFSVFETGPLSEDLRPVWDLAGKAMAEEIKYGPRMGVKVIEDIGARILKEGPKFDLSKVRTGLELAAQVRKDDAEFLRMNFGYEPDLKEAVSALEDAAQNYQSVVEEIKDGIADQEEARRIARRLVAAASDERKAGETFLKRAQILP